MKKICPVCYFVIEDNSPVLAICPTVYHELPSKIAYAMEPPQQCLTMMHYDCGFKEIPGDENIQGH